MQVWFSAQEIADLAQAGQLPGLPTTKRGVNMLADREAWAHSPALCRIRTGREGGGGSEYHLDLLPLGVRLTYVARQFRINPAVFAVPTDDAPLTQRARNERDARLVALRLADAFRRSSGLTSKAADDYFVRLFNARMLDTPDWLGETIGTLSTRSLARWRTAAREGANLLAHDPATARKGTGLLDTANDGEVRNTILALIAAQPHLAAREVRKQCRAAFGDELVDRHGALKPMPPERTFQHFLKALKADNKVLLTKLTDPDRFRSHYALSGTGALSHIREPNQLWQIDASPLDALCVDGRHSIYVCLDIATRRVAITVSRTPRASAVCLMIRKAILAWGVARTIKTDNGSDFVARETSRLFRALDIEVELSDAYSPQQKGHVERVIKTFQHQFAPLLPGYIGHNVADRKAIEGRKSFAQRLGATDAETFSVSLTAAQLQHYIDEWVELTYHQAPHSALANRSPADVAAASSTPIRRVDERALDVLLMPVPDGNGLRVMSKRGLKIDGFHYLTGEILPGTQVFVRMDPMDAGRVRAFTPDGATYLCTAECPQLSGIRPAALLAAARERQAEILEDTLRPVRANLRALTKGPALIERALEVDRRDHAARQEKAANIIRLPQREQHHATPQIDAAVAAFEPPSKPVRATYRGDAVAEHHRRLMAEINGSPPETNVTALRKAETPEHRFRRMIEIERRRDAGQSLTEDEAYELGSYQQSAEYKSRRKMMDDFGDQAPGLRT